MKRTLFAASMIGLTVISVAQAAITYVDAELHNTTLNGAPLQAGINYSMDFTAIDGLWGWRTNRTDVNGNTVWETDGGSYGGILDAEDTAPLKIVITLPNAGTYNLYAVIMNNNSGTGHWDVAARIGDYGLFTAFNKYSQGSTQALAADFAGSVKVSSGGDMTFKVLIGQYETKAANETVSVYINGLDSWGSTGLDQRTRFDGVGYEMTSGPLPWAVNVSPVDGAQNVLCDRLLEWTPGAETAAYNICLGTDEDAVAFRSDVDGSGKADLEDLALIACNWQKAAVDSYASRLDIDQSGAIGTGDLERLANDWLACNESVFLGSVPGETLSFHPVTLLPDMTYYWRIDGVADQGIYKGDVWSFRTNKADGLTASMYNDMYFSNLKVTRVDAQVNFNWGANPPDAAVNADKFSIAWEGGITVPEKGDYTFYTNSDDGTRLYVNDILIIDRWIDHSMAEYSGFIHLRPGTVYPIRLEYFDNTGSAAVQLLWSGPGISKQVIPATYLSSVLPISIPTDIWVVNPDPMPMKLRLLTITLQGLVSKEKTAIMLKQGGLTAMIRQELEQEGTVFHDNATVWQLLSIFHERIDGLVVCGSDLANINAATSLCGPLNAVAVDESLLIEVQSRTGLPVLADVRGMNELAVYNGYKHLFGHEMMVDVDKVDFLRDISVTRNAFTFYNVDSATRIQFISGLTSQGVVMGWGSNAEYHWVKDVSTANAAGVPADWCKNLSMLAKVPVNIPKPPRRYPAPVQEGQRIIAFSMSDGDNLQVMSGDFIVNQKFFGHPARGTFPMSWEFPPSMGALNSRGVRCYYNAASQGDNPDCFIAGPSGSGYAFHHYMPNRRAFAKNTAQAMKKCGMTVVTLINENNASMSEVNELLERPEIMGIAYKDWAPYNRRNGAIYWHNGKPSVNCKFLLWGSDAGDPSNLGDWETVSAGIAAMPSSPATNQGSYAIINANAWSFGAVGGPMQAIINTINLLPPNTRLVTVEELIILLRNNFGDPVTEQQYNAM